MRALLLVFMSALALGGIIYWPFGYQSRVSAALAKGRRGQAWAEALAGAGLSMVGLGVVLAVAAVTFLRSDELAQLGWRLLVGGAVLHIVSQFFAGAIRARYD